jgi:hypothetical protein
MSYTYEDCSHLKIFKDTDYLLPFRNTEQFIYDKGRKLMPEEFFINFGYKTREYGEQQFKKAVTSVHDSLGEEEDEERELKMFLYTEFIKDKFQVSELGTEPW